MSAGILLSLTASALCSSGNHTIRGSVVDGSTNQHVSFAVISVVGSHLGTTANQEGAFEISLPHAEATLLVSCAGYKTETVKVDGGDSIVIVIMTPVSYLLQEVSVYAEQRKSQQVSSAEIQNEQVRDLAGMTKDPLRSVQLMPGVSVDNEASNKINVRGGTSDENLILINGVEVYNPNHLKELANGSISIFNIDMVKSIDFSAGGFSVKYGDALSSMTKVNYREGDTAGYKGKIDLSLLDLSGLFEGPVNRNGSFIIGVRKSYLDYLMRITNVPSTIYMGYYDVQGQVNYSLDGSNRLRADFIFSRDNASQTPTNSHSQSGYYTDFNNNKTLIRESMNSSHEGGGDYSNSLLSLMSSNVFSASLFSQTSLSYYNEVDDEHSSDSTVNNYSYDGYPQFWSRYSNRDNLTDNLVIKTFSLNEDVTFQASAFLNFDAGVNYKKIYYDDDPNMHGVESFQTNDRQFPDTTIYVYPPDPSYNDTTVTLASTYSMAAYLQQTLQIEDNVIFNLGVRADYFDMNKETKLAPRASLSYMLPDGVTFRAATGVFYQPPSYLQLRLKTASGNNTGFQEATHYIFGIEKKFSRNADLRTEFYYKDYSNLIPTIRLGDGELAYGQRLNDAKGYATGMDLALTASYGSMDIWASYGYLVAKEKLTDGSEGFYPRYTDQTHTLSLAFIYHLGNGWSTDLRAYFGSGYAYTPYVSHYDSTEMMYIWKAGTENSAHYPSYERVDLRIEKVVTLFDKPMLLYIDVMNLFNRRNVLSYSYTYDANGNPEIRSNYLYGLIPTLGVSYSF